MKFESVKIPADIVNKVRKNKKKTKIPVGAFFAMAAEEKLGQQRLKDFFFKVEAPSDHD